MPRRSLAALALGAVVACGGAAIPVRPTPPVAPTAAATVDITVRPEMRVDPDGDELPAGIVATGYVLDVDLRDPAGYQVTEVIRLRAGEPIDRLWLHAATDVVIEAAHVDVGVDVPATRHEASVVTWPDRDVVRLEFPPIAAGPLTLTLRVRTPYRVGGPGLVRVGEAIVADLGAGARGAWPCIDATDRRATWRVRVVAPGGAVVVGGPGTRRGDPDLAFRGAAAAHQIAFVVAPLVRDGDVAAPVTVFVEPRVAGQAAYVHWQLADALYAVVGEACSPRQPTQVVMLPGLVAVLGRRAVVGLGLAVVDADADLAALAHGMARVCFGARAVPRTPGDAWLIDSLAAWAADAVTLRVGAALGWTSPTPRLSAATPRLRRLLLASVDVDAHRTTGEIDPPTLGAPADPTPDDPLVRSRGAIGMAAYASWRSDALMQGELRALLRTADERPVDLDDMIAVPSRAMRFFGMLRDRAVVPRVAVAAACRDGKLLAVVNRTPDADIGVAPEDPWSWRLDAVPVCVRSSGAREGTPPVCTALGEAIEELELPGPCSAAVIGNAGGTGFHLLGLDGASGATLVAAIPFMTPPELTALAADLVGELAVGTLRVDDAAALVLPSRLTGDAPELEPVWRAIGAAVPRAERARWSRLMRRDVRARVLVAVPRYARDATTWARGSALPDDAEARADLAELGSWRGAWGRIDPDLAAIVGARLGWACGDRAVAAMFSTLLGSGRARDAELANLLRPTMQLCTLVAAAQRVAWQARDTTAR